MLINNKHPEAYCQKCGEINPAWFAPNELWNKVTGHPPGLILCPHCFQILADEKKINIVFKAQLVSEE